MENSSYDVFLNQILGTPLLLGEIQKLKEQSCALNLISTSWSEDLENSQIYQDHKNKKVKYNQGHFSGTENKVFVRNIIDKHQKYNIIVAGEFILKKNDNGDYSIVAKNCEPLDMIALSMQEDENRKLYTGGRFFVNLCHPFMCHYCTDYHRQMKMPMVRKNWCVLGLKMFDGKRIINACTSMIQRILTDLPSFMAIFNMEIMSRTSFGENSYKVGGSIKSMIVFQSMSLNKNNLLSIPNSSELAIEYYSSETGTVEEEEEEEEA